ARLARRAAQLDEARHVPSDADPQGPSRDHPRAAQVHLRRAAPRDVLGEPVRELADGAVGHLAVERERHVPVLAHGPAQPAGHRGPGLETADRGERGLEVVEGVVGRPDRGEEAHVSIIAHAGQRWARALAKRQTAAAVARLSDSACPRIGTRTAASARARSVSGRPHASLPNSHVVGAARSGADPLPAVSSSSSRSRSPRPSAARIVSPAPRSSGAASASSTPVTTGRWNSEPALERTTLGLCTSTLSAVTTTSSAPAASAARITVPALPGSRTRARSATRRGALAASASSRRTGTIARTARTPCASGLMTRATSSLAVRTRSPAARASSTISGWRAWAVSETNSSRTRSGAKRTASRTPWGPSTRKVPVRLRAEAEDGERPDSARTAATRSARGLVSSGAIRALREPRLRPRRAR